MRRTSSDRQRRHDLRRIARRLDLNTLQVTETMAYYSMLRRKPPGKYPRAGLHQRVLHVARREKIYETCEKTGDRPQANHADGMFSLEEVECMGACTGAPAMQVNYDFHENLTRSADEFSKRSKAGKKPTPVPHHPVR